MSYSVNSFKLTSGEEVIARNYTDDETATHYSVEYPACIKSSPEAYHFAAFVSTADDSKITLNKKIVSSCYTTIAEIAKNYEDDFITNKILGTDNSNENNS